uniref:Ribosomal eL28/Mak16 domain-containing protein n=1 Tax=Bicosoecida sp. CB-2014 TaxID=1486930 RepID=A0A7S1CLQ0_9STRA
MAALHSDNVVWDAVKAHHCRIRKSHGIVLSGEAGNLTNKHAFKFSGFANKKTLDVNATDGSAKYTFPVALRASTPKNANKPGKAAETVVLAKGGFARGAANIRKYSSGRCFRADLERAALARYTALVRGATPARKGVAQKKAGRRRR